MRILIASLTNVREEVGGEGDVNRHTMRKIARSLTDLQCAGARIRSEYQAFSTGTSIYMTERKTDLNLERDRQSEE